MYTKSFHASTKDLRICANNPALEDFVIQITLRISAHVRKNVHVSICLKGPNIVFQGNCHFVTKRPICSWLMSSVNHHGL